MSDDKDKYSEIINVEWPRTSLRPRMPLNQRAKIFLPFAALTGFEEKIERTAAEKNGDKDACRNICVAEKSLFT